MPLGTRHAIRNLPPHFGAEPHFPATFHSFQSSPINSGLGEIDQKGGV